MGFKIIFDNGIFSIIVNEYYWNRTEGLLKRKNPIYEVIKNYTVMFKSKSFKACKNYIKVFG